MAASPRAALDAAQCDVTMCATMKRRSMTFARDAKRYKPDLMGCT